jgi:zinc transport system ATP-binding protein
MTAPVIEVEDVWVSWNGEPVLEGVNLTVCEGDFFAIIGPNGGGKTTLLKVILGLIHPNKGCVRVFGGTPEENRKYLGYVPQFRTFDFDYPITVMEMVLSGRLGHVSGMVKRYNDDDVRFARKALGTMGIDHLARRELQGLSGGEQQRAIIARALAGEPKILLLDEPTVYVDTPTETHFYDILDHLKETLTIVLVSHDIGVISTHVTKVGCLNRKLYTHDSAEITEDMLEGGYPCPVDLIAHGVPHRVFREHE